MLIALQSSEKPDFQCPYLHPAISAIDLKAFFEKSTSVGFAHNDQYTSSMQDHPLELELTDGMVALVSTVVSSFAVLCCLVCWLWLSCTSLDTCCHSRHCWVSDGWKSTGLLRLCCWRCLHHTPWHSCNDTQEKSTRISQNHVEIVHKNSVSFIVLFGCYLAKSWCVTVVQKLPPVLV